MKQKILASIATGLIIFSGTVTPLAGFFFTQFQTPTAHAQPTDVTPSNNWNSGNNSQFNAQQVDNTNIDTNQAGSNPTVDQLGQESNVGDTPEEKKAAEEAAAAAKGDALKCGLNPVCNAVKMITTVVMYPSFYFAAMGGLFMDYVIWGTINSTSYSDGTDGNQSGIGSLAVAGWKLVRDITNIVFIFALFVVGFNLILNRETANEQGKIVAANSFGMDPKRTLVRVILMALLVNFSFFFGKVIITTANVAAVVFFNKIDTPAAASNASGTSDGGDISTLYGYNYFPGIKAASLAILAKSNPQALVLQTGSDAGSGSSMLGVIPWGSYDWSTYVLILCVTGMVSFFNFFLCYIFFSIAFLLLGRTLGLVMALIVSPLAFVSFAIPSLEDKPYIGFSDWFTQFVGLAATAPIFLFFLYLVISSLKIGFATGSDAGFFATGLFIMIKLSFTSGVLILAKRITKNLAGRVGAIATKVATTVVVNAAIIGSAAATGGASAALFAARRQATQGAISAGNKLIGNERTEALQKRLGGLRNFRTLPSSPRDAIMGLSGIIAPGSKVPGQVNEGISLGQRYGGIVNRNNNIQNIRKDRLAAEAAAAKKKADDRVTYKYDDRKAAQDLRDKEKAKGGTPATFNDVRRRAMEMSDFTPTQQTRIKKKLAENKAKISTAAAKSKAKLGVANNTPVTGVPKSPVDARVAKIDQALRNREAQLNNPMLRKDQKDVVQKSYERLENLKKNLLAQTTGAPKSNTVNPGTSAAQNNIPPIIPPNNNPPAGGASPVGPTTPPIAGAQPIQIQTQQAAQTKTQTSVSQPGTITGGPQTNQTKVGPVPGQTQPTDGTTRPKSAFSGDANFDRPKAQLVDPQGRPVSSADLAQKEESQRLAGQYRKDTSNLSTQIENLTVKANNLNIIGNAGTAPTITMPNRGSNGGSAAGNPRERAATLLSNIQMPPRAASSVSNYTSKTFAPVSAMDRTNEPVKNVNTILEQAAARGAQERAVSPGLIDTSGNTITSQSKPNTNNSKIIS